MHKPLTKSEAISLCFSGGLPCLAVFLYSEYMRSVEGVKGQLPDAATAYISLYVLSFAPQVFFILCGCPGQGSSDNTICSIDLKCIMRTMSLLNTMVMGKMIHDTTECFDAKPEDAMYTKALCEQCYDEGTHNGLYTSGMMIYAFLCFIYLVKKNGPDFLEHLTISRIGLFTGRSNSNDGSSYESAGATRPRSGSLEYTSGYDSDEDYGASRWSYSPMPSTSGSESD